MKTFTIHGLLHCFNTFSQQNNLPLNDNLNLNSIVSNDVWNLKEDISKDINLFDNIHICIANDKNVIENWNAKKDLFQYSINEINFHLKTVYIFDQKWKTKIEKVPESIKEDSKLLKLNKVFGVKGRAFVIDGLDVCFVETEKGHILLKLKHSDISFSDLYLKFSQFNKNITNLRSFELDLYIPTFNVEDEFSFEISGFSPFKGLTVTEAKNKNILSFDKNGVFVKSETTVSMTRSISIKKELLVSEDFELAVFENGSVYPTIVARIDKKDLLK